MTDSRCHECAHQRRLPRYGQTPTCARAKHPHGGDAQLACVLAWERCLGKFFEARR
jgi:hypothetical protein